MTRDRAWLAVLAAFFVFGLAVSWQRWGNPLIDSGREMNQPLRLASGEMLYSDVRHIYGPLSPWLHAGMFRLFGPSLTVLYLDGIFTAILVIALVYWLGRRIMPPAGAAAAALSVMWLCVFKPAGNYILPYSYNSLHGAALGLIALAVLVAALERGQHLTIRPFLTAGVVAGVATLAKTEMGFAAYVAGVTAAMVGSYPDVRRGCRLAMVFVAAAASLTIAVYGLIAMRVGWSTLVDDSWLFLYNVPPELTFYNQWVSGFDDPLHSLKRMLIAAAKLGIVAAGVGAISVIIGEGTRSRAGMRAYAVLVAAVAIGVVMSVTTGLDLDKGPYLAMPFLLIAAVGVLIRRVRNARGTGTAARTAILTVCAAYALASLARMALNVRSGGAYASFLLPVSVVMFTYFWIGPFAGCFRQPRVRRIVSTASLVLILGNSVVTAGILAYRYQTRSTVVIASERGTIIAEPDVGRAWNEALAYIDRHVGKMETVAVLPEGSSLNFLSGRRNPLREEIALPGVLDDAAESRAISQLHEAATPVVLITNRPTLEFGRAGFGRDYGLRLMRWIEDHYDPCAVFGPVKDEHLEIGDRPFFIRAYCAQSQITNQ